MFSQNTKISIFSTLIEKTRSPIFSPLHQLQQFLSTTTNLPHQEQSTINHHQEPTKLPKKPTSSYYDELISIAGHSRDLTTMKNLLNQRITHGCFNTSKTFNFLTHYTKDTHLLSTMVKELTETLSKLTPGYGKKNAFDSLIASLCKHGHPDHALFVIKQMTQTNKTTPNACTFHPLINFYSRKKQMEKVKLVFQFMKDREISPDLACYNYVLTALCHVGHLSKAAELLGVMLREEEKLGSPDSTTFDALVLGACRARKMEGALALLRRMVEDGVKVSYCTYAHVISGFLHLGRFDEALGFVVEVSGRNHLADNENFGFLGRCLVRRKMVVEARLVLREMEKRGLECRDELGKLLADLGCEKPGLKLSMVG